MSLTITYGDNSLTITPTKNETIGELCLRVSVGAREPLRIIALARPDGALLDDSCSCAELLASGLSEVNAVWKPLAEKGSKGRSSKKDRSRRSSVSGTSSASSASPGSNKRSSRRDGKERRDRTESKDRPRREGRGGRRGSAVTALDINAAAFGDTKMTLNVYIPKINARTQFTFKRAVTAGRACQLIAGKLAEHLDVTDSYGMCPTASRDGVGKTLEPEVPLGLALRDGDTIAFGPLLDEDDLTDPFFNRKEFEPLKGTPWDNSLWTRTDDGGLAEGEAVIATVTAPEFGVTKTAQFASGDSVRQAVELFAAKVDAANPQDYALFYQMHGTAEGYEIEMNPGERIGSFANNLVLASVIFRKKYA